MTIANKEIKNLIACLLSYSFAGIFIGQHLIIPERHYVYSDLHQALGLVVLSVWLTLVYYKGVTEWKWTLALHLWNWFVFCAVVDGINIAMVYNDTYPSQSAGNAILNDGLVYFNLLTCTGIYIMINLVIFVLIAPNIPRWLHKEDGMLR